MSDYQFNPNVEQWKEIDDFPGYKVSDHGRVKSYLVHKTHGRFLKPNPLNRGHLQVILMLQGTRYGKLIHRLVLSSFVGECSPGMECCHNDDIPSNNHLPNLRWDTRKSNVQDSINCGTFARGMRRGTSKLSDSEVREIRYLYSIGEKTKTLANKFNTHTTNIWYIVSRTTWKHLL